MDAPVNIWSFPNQKAANRNKGFIDGLPAFAFDITRVERKPQSAGNNRRAVCYRYSMVAVDRGLPHQRSPLENLQFTVL